MPCHFSEDNLQDKHLKSSGLSSVSESMCMTLHMCDKRIRSAMAVIIMCFKLK